jgi:hypothetical protein
VPSFYGQKTANYKLNVIITRFFAGVKREKPDKLSKNFGLRQHKPQPEAFL